MNKSEASEVIDLIPNLFEYGAKMSVDCFRDMFGVKVMDDEEFTLKTTGMHRDEIKKLLDDETLAELSAADSVRSKLLDVGRHFYKAGNFYHVALPSENEGIARNYNKKASRAIAKAKRLMRNTPATMDGHKTTTASASAMMRSPTDKYTHV